MKKRLLSLALALILCLTLAAPALAADASALDAAAAKAYAGVLEEQITKYGIREREEGKGVQYAGLEDMDADGTPELVILAAEEKDFSGQAINIGIWRMQSGKAVRTADAIMGYHFVTSGRIAFARKGGQTRLLYEFDWSYRSFYGREAALISADGTCDSSAFDSGSEGYSPSVDSPEDVTYDKSWQADSTPLMSVVDFRWAYSASQAQAVRSLQVSLTANANSSPISTASTYGSYTLLCRGMDETICTVVFDAAMVETKTVMVQEEDMEGNIGPFEARSITLITVRPGSSIRIQNPNSPAKLAVYDGGGTVVSNGYYSIWYTGDVAGFEGGIAESVLASNKLIIPAVRDQNINLCLIVLGTDTAATISTTGFTDVPASAYYANAVTWAVGKGITNGTGTNTFSPENTCNNAEILTFLWRAKGQPEPTVSNPFRNVKSSDYYYKAALWAYQNGLVSGSSFNASTPCTRSMVAAYLWKAAGSPAAGASGFSDVSSSASYAQAVAWAVQQGITNGDGVNTFSPNKTCTRGQIVTFLNRAFA